jgi:hypothetical protein
MNISICVELEYEHLGFGLQIWIVQLDLNKSFVF